MIAKPTQTSSDRCLRKQEEGSVSGSVQAHLGDIAGSGPDHRRKVSRSPSAGGACLQFFMKNATSAKCKKAGRDNTRSACTLTVCLLMLTQKLWLRKEKGLL